MIYILTALLVIYGLVFYMQFTQQLRLDFSSFYSTSLAAYQGDDPYQNLLTTYFPVAKKLPANLNPPVFLLLFQPFSQFHYYLAVPLWAACSFLLGLIGAWITGHFAFPGHHNQQGRFALMLVYLALFATLMNTVIAQMGAVLLFFIMAGYYYYRRGQDLAAASLWASITALKLFPGLLLFLALKERRYKLSIYFAIIFAVLWSMPLYYYGIKIYQQYFYMLSRVLWYGDSWNGSIYGFLFRLFIDPNNRHQSLLLIKLSYLILFIALAAWYFKKLGDYPQANPHYPLCLTLVMMLLLSPFGWLYYFSLLLLPLALTWQQLAIKIHPPELTLLWFISFFLLNLPLDYVMSTKMNSLSDKVVIYSLYFYGLVWFTYVIIRLLGQNEQITFEQEKIAQPLLLPVVIILSFGLIVPIACFILRLYGAGCG